MLDQIRNLSTKTWPWAGTAVVMVAGFMYWLYAESSTAGTDRDGTAERELVEVDDTAFAQQPERFSNRRVVLRSVKVAEALGRATFILELPDRPGYPVILERNLVERQTTLVRGEPVVLAGSVYALNDSLINIYAQRGLFEPANRDKLTGRSTFFLVDSVAFLEPATEAAPADSPRAREPERR